MDTTKSQQLQHTPFCKETCSVKHSELITCLVNCPDNKRMIKGLASLKQSLFQSLQEGWNPHANVIDPLIEFQTPLIHWAAVLGKDFALEWLIKMNFRTNAVCERTGESAVHRMLKCLYAIKQLDGMNAREIFTLFSHLLSLLMGTCTDLLTVQDKEGNTAFHTCASLIINQEGTTSELEYFENCMVSMLRSLSGEKSSTNSSGLSQVLNYKNNDSETILHILARRNASFNIMRYVIRRFNHVIDKNSLNKEGKSAFDIAITSQTYSVAKELGSTDNRDVDNPVPSFSVDTHIAGEWDPSFGRPSKLHTSKPRQRSKKNHARAESKSTQSRVEKNVCEETSEVETLEVDSSASSSSSTNAYMTSGVCDNNKQASSPEILFHQGSESPPSMQSSSSAPDKMDVNIAGMISVNLTNVVAVDTDDLSASRVAQEVSSSAGGERSEQEFNGHSLSYISHQVQRQRSETRRKSTAGKERSGRIGPITTASPTVRNLPETHDMIDTRCNLMSDPTINDKFQPASSVCQHGGNIACNCKTSCSPLMRLIKEESDVATLLEARLKDKRQMLETYLLDYTKQMREMEKRGSRCCLLLSDYKDEREAIIDEEQLKEQEKRKLLQRFEELEKSRIEPRKRLKFLEAKIVELESLSEQSLKTIEIRNEHCSEVKRKLTEYDSALSEIADQSENLVDTKRIKVEPLDKYRVPSPVPP